VIDLADRGRIAERHAPGTPGFGGAPPNFIRAPVAPDRAVAPARPDGPALAVPHDERDAGDRAPDNNPRYPK